MMEVAVSGPVQSLSEPLRRTTTPLRQLVEESRRASVNNHLLDSKIYSRLRINGLIQAEPSALHFSGFELGKDYHEVLKLINISSEVINVHIIATQTKYFKTTYTKKYRLIPGLAYTVKVQFHPDEWRYFYDCIRVHCKGEENLLVPVHAYPVIDDLNIPSHIDLPAVPLGRSVVHAIPLSCSCPVDFEFQVHIVQPHRAFSVQPLAGVIPARGALEITVIFSPLQYETCEITMQLLISQFNTKPYLCTITGRSAPHLAIISKLESRQGAGGDEAVSDCRGSSSPAPRVPPAAVPTKRRSTRKADKLKAVRDQAAGPKPPLDVSTPAGVAKMLVRSTHKLTSRDLREAISCGIVADVQSKQVKEALFMKRVQQDVQEERDNHLRWHVRLGKDPVSGETKRVILEEREMALYEYRVKKGDVRDDVHLDQTKLSTRRVLCEVGQEPKGTPPSFQLYGSGVLQVRHRALRLFQQAARRVTVQCRMTRRLASLKKLAVNVKKLPLAQKRGAGGEESCPKKVSPRRVLPFSFPVFHHDDDVRPVPSNLSPVPVDPIDVNVMSNIPYFNLQVPQRYKQVEYQAVSTWEAYAGYIPTTLARPLRTGALDELLPGVTYPGESLATAETKTERGEEAEEAKTERGEEAEEAKDDTITASLSFSAEALLRPSAPTNPLRIFNPAPGLQTYKVPPKYLESDLEYHLCPLPRYGVSEGSARHLNTPNTQTPSQKYLDRKEVINGIMTWKSLDSAALCLSTLTTLTTDEAWYRPVDDNPDLLPLTAPPPLTGLPDDLAEVVVKPTEGPAFQLTPEMIRAEFPWDQTSPSSSRLDANMTAGYDPNKLRKNVMAELIRLGAACESTTLLAGEDCE